LLGDSTLKLQYREALPVGEESLAQAAFLHVAQRFGRSLVTARSLQAGMEEVRHFPRELVERAEEIGVELVVLLKQPLDDGIPDPLGVDLGKALARRGGRLLLVESAAKQDLHVLRRLP